VRLKRLRIQNSVSVCVEKCFKTSHVFANRPENLPMTCVVFNILLCVANLSLALCTVEVQLGKKVTVFYLWRMAFADCGMVHERFFCHALTSLATKRSRASTFQQKCRKVSTFETSSTDHCASQLDELWVQRVWV